MKKKLSKVLAVVLSLVLAVGLAAVDGASVAQAAKKAKKLTLVKAGDLNVTSGETRVIKIKGNKAKKAKWSVKGDGASYVSLNKTKGKKVKMTVADNATGTVKVVAKLTKKNKVTVTYTLSCEATAITLADAEGYTNEAIALETTVTPSNATAVDVTYAVYTDEAATTAAEKATVADGALTATEAGTYYVVATAGTLTSNIAKVVVTDKLAQVTGVKQTRKNVIEVTFDADASKVTDDTLLIENVLGVRVNIQKIVLDEAKTTATVTTLVNMADGKEHTVTYGESSATFTATTGEVAAITVTPDEAPINTKITVWAQAVDVNGVILDEVKFGSSNASYEFTVDIADGGQTDEQNGQIIMDTIGAKAIVDVVYHSNEFDANGEEITFSAKEEIVAVAEGIISSYDKVAFVAEDVTEKAYTAIESWKFKDKVRVDGGLDNSFWVTTYVKDDLGNVRVDGSLTAAGYTLESADDTYLLVDEDRVTGIREGKTFILVKKENEVIFTIPVEIQAASKLTSIELSKSTVYLTAGNVAAPSAYYAGEWEEDYATVSVSAKDQYGEDYGNVAVTYEAASTTNNEDVMGIDVAGQTVTVTAATRISDETLAPGKYQSNTYTVKVADTKFGGEFTKKLFARVTQPQSTAASMALAVDTTKQNTTVLNANNSHLSNQYSTIKLALYDAAGTLMHYEYLPAGAMVEVKKGGSTVANVVRSDYSADAITGAGFVIVDDFAVVDADNCAACDGLGLVTCAGCTGTGTVEDTCTAGCTAGAIACPTCAAITGDCDDCVDAVIAGGCTVCEGDGKVDVDCPTCGGEGTVTCEDCAVVMDAASDSYEFVTRARFDQGVTANWQGYATIAKLATGSYKIYVKGIEFNKTTKMVDYTGDSNDYLTTTITVADAQDTIAIGQDSKTTTLAISENDKNGWDAIANEALRVEAPKSANGNNDITYMEVLSAKVDPGKSIAITKVRVHVFYVGGGYWDGSYVVSDVNVNYTIKAE